MWIHQVLPAYPLIFRKFWPLEQVVLLLTRGGQGECVTRVNPFCVLYVMCLAGGQGQLGPLRVSLRAVAVVWGPGVDRSAPRISQGK